MSKPGDRLRRLIDLYGDRYRAIADEQVCGRLEGCGSLLIFGAGQNGAQVLRLMRRAGLTPVAFVDDTPAKIGASCDGVPIISLEAAARLPDPVAVSSIFSPTHDFLAIAQRLDHAGVASIPLFRFLWAYGDADLPFYFLDRPETLVAARDSLDWLSERLLDSASQALLDGQVEFRLSLRYEALPPWRLGRLPPPATWPSVHLIDAGAFDGDTLLPLLQSEGSRIAGAVALEPDPATFERLADNLRLVEAAASGPLVALRAAVDRRQGRRRFADLGNPGSSFSEEGVTVDTVSIDDVVAAHCGPDARLHIKFDVEGAESEALEGARETLRRRRPFLAVAAYHKPSDLWALPRLICDIDDGYRFLLRSHGADGADLTLYAVPPT